MVMGQRFGNDHKRVKKSVTRFQFGGGFETLSQQMHFGAATDEVACAIFFREPVQQ